MVSLQNETTLAFICLVASTFVIWIGVAYHPFQRMAKIVLGAGATVFASLAFIHLISGTSIWPSLLASTALANPGIAVDYMTKRT